MEVSNTIKNNYIKTLCSNFQDFKKNACFSANMSHILKKNCSVVPLTSLRTEPHIHAITETRTPRMTDRFQRGNVQKTITPKAQIYYSEKMIDKSTNIPASV